MSSLTIFKSMFVNSLHGSIALNLDKYVDNNAWLNEEPAKRSHEIITGLELDSTVALELPENGDLKDTSNAINFHKALRHLTPLQARDPRLWTKLSHINYWSYMRSRWPVDKLMNEREKAVRFIDSRYFVTQNQSRALLRNGIARLWWTAELTHDPARENPYELTAILFSTLDVTQQLAERNMGRSPNVTKGFLEFLSRNSNILLIGGDKNRQRIRKLAKYLNMVGGVCVLDVLSRNEIIGLLDKEFNNILVAENKEADRISA